jgi:hypothetical protein
MKKADIEVFFARLKEQRPEPRTELEYVFIVGAIDGCRRE